MSNSLAIAYVAPKTLKPYPGNARTHSPGQIRQIADSIRRFGFTNPILVDKSRMVIAGHGRLKAAEMLGLDAVPVIRLEHLSEPSAGPTSLPTTNWRRKPAGTLKPIEWDVCPRTKNLGV